MMRVGRGTRSGLFAALMWLGAMLSGCGGGSSGAGLQGLPPASVVAGQPYSFQPQPPPDQPAGALTYTVSNLPQWAAFDASTGRLSGTPSEAQVGQYPGIVIAALNNGVQVAATAAFSITVSTPSANSVELSWQPPTENVDGTALTDLQGYEVHYGNAPQDYSETIRLANPGLTNYVVQNLPAGTYYFAVTAYNTAGMVSTLSPEVSATVN